MENNRPKVGVAAYIFNDKNELLLLRRKGAHGEGTWCAPGGHLELGESFEDCSKREAMEEMGVKIVKVKYLTATNDIFSKEKHYITISMSAKIIGGKPKLMEPEKSTEFGWFSLKKLPNPKFLSFKNFLKRKIL